MTPGRHRTVALAAAVSVLAIGLLLVVGQGIATGPVDYTDPPPSDEYADQHVQESAAAQEKFATETFPTLGIDPGKLPRTEISALYAIEQPTLGDAARAARTIALIDVTSVTFRRNLVAEITARPVSVWKGSAEGELRFQQVGSVDRSDGGAVYILETMVSPLLLPGDRAVVFLSPPSDDWGGLPHMFMFTGWYRVDADGRVVPAEAAPRSVAALAGKTVDDLKAAVDLALAD